MDKKHFRDCRARGSGVRARRAIFSPCSAVLFETCGFFTVEVLKFYTFHHSITPGSCNTALLLQIVFSHVTIKTYSNLYTLEVSSRTHRLVPKLSNIQWFNRARFIIYQINLRYFEILFEKQIKNYNTPSYPISSLSKRDIRLY